MEGLRFCYEVSIRRACEVLRFERSSFYYRSCANQQIKLRMRIKELAANRVRYGYRRLHVLLLREGWQINHKQVYRLYKEEGLSLRLKSKKKRTAPTAHSNACSNGSERSLEHGFYGRPALRRQTISASDVSR